MPMEMKPVYSSMVDAVGYDPDAQELRVQFKSGKVAAYRNVPESVARSVVNAPSVGTALNDFIKGVYPWGYV